MWMNAIKHEFEDSALWQNSKKCKNLGTFQLILFIPELFQN